MAGFFSSLLSFLSHILIPANARGPLSRISSCHRHFKYSLAYLLDLLTRLPRLLNW